MADIDKLFEQISSEVLTEEVKLQMAVLFETALNEAVAAKEKQIEEKAMTDLKGYKEKLTEQIDTYLTYFAEEFVKTNSGVIEDSVKVKTAEKVLRVFNGMVNDFHLQLDERKVDAEDKLKESKEALNDLTNQLLEAKKEIKAHQKAAIVMEAAGKLETELQKAKLVEYAKKLDFDELYEKKINTFVATSLQEKKVETPAPEKIVITEEKEEDVKTPEESVTKMSDYLNRL